MASLWWLPPGRVQSSSRQRIRDLARRRLALGLGLERAPAPGLKFYRASFIGGHVKSATNVFGDSVGSVADINGSPASLMCGLSGGGERSCKLGCGALAHRRPTLKSRQQPRNTNARTSTVYTERKQV